MELTYICAIAFILVTSVYYFFPMVGKLPLTLDMLYSQSFKNYNQLNRARLFLYFVTVLITQFVVVVVYLVNTCNNGTAGQNVSSAALSTLLPWTFIFGLMILVLLNYPNIKAAFSNVVGYYFVANKANQIFNSLLFNTTLSSLGEGAVDENVKTASNAVTKILSNNAIVINKMTPGTFASTWQLLEPLMTTDKTILSQNHDELFKLIVYKDNIGEAFWYLYTGILIISIVGYNISATGCPMSAKGLAEKYNDYEASQNPEKAPATTAAAAVTA